MKRKPTLAQMKKRPSLWWEPVWEVLRVHYPDGRVQMLRPAWENKWKPSPVESKDLINYQTQEFVSWL